MAKSKTKKVKDANITKTKSDSSSDVKKTNDKPKVEQMEKPRVIPGRNYIIAIILLVVAALITLYGFNLYNLYQENKIANSYLISSKTIQHEIKDLYEVKSVLSEAPDEFFLFISYTNSEETYKLEKDLKDIIKKYDLADQFYYLNVTDIKDDENLITKINEALELNGEVEKIPTIIYYVNGEIAVDGIIIREDESLMNAGDFQKLLDIHSISE